MRNNILLFFCFWTALGTSYGQAVEGKVFNKNGYQAWVTLKDSSDVHGLLWNVDSEKIEIKSDQVKNWKKPDSGGSVLEIPIERVKSIRTKRVHAVWKGYGYGVLTGIAVGSVGAIIFEAIDADEGSILLVPMGGFLGSGIGIVAGLMPDKTYVINEDLKEWNSIFPDLEKKAFWRQLR